MKLKQLHWELCVSETLPLGISSCDIAQYTSNEWLVVYSAFLLMSLMGQEVSLL